MGRIAAASDLHEVLNVAVLIACSLGWADVIWHDIGGRDIFPRLDGLLRHRICLAVYASIGGIWLVKAWVAMWSGVAAAWVLAAFCVTMALSVGIATVALAREQRT